MPKKKITGEPADGGETPIPVIKEIRLRKASEQAVQVEHVAELPLYVRPKKIHPRRTLPLVREGLEREFHSLTEPVLFHHAMPMFGPLANTDDLVVTTNTPLADPASHQRASNVGEPSAAINEQVVFYTGNWYAAISSDGGKTFRFIDPARAFLNSDPPGSNFCCDQVVHYLGAIDTFVWLMQYGPDTDNIQRLAFATTAEVVQGRWRMFDITTHLLNVPGFFMDFPDLAVGANCLYVTTNLFGPANQVGSAVIRIPLAGIKSGTVVAHPFVRMDLQSFRVAQNCGKSFPVSKAKPKLLGVASMPSTACS